MSSCEILWPFGRYAGCRLGEIPSSSLTFILRNNDGRHADLVQDAADELDRRQLARSQPSISDVLGVLALWRRRLDALHEWDVSALETIDEADRLLQQMLAERGIACKVSNHQRRS